MSLGPQLTRRRLLAAALVGGLGLMGRPALERLAIVVERTTVRVAPASRPLPELRLALLTDLHIGNWASHRLAERVVAMTNRLAPDLVLLGGDLVHDDVSTAELRATARALERLQAPLGRFAVLGNHDYEAGEERVQAAMEDAGLRVLRNEGLRLRLGERSLWLAGLDDCLVGRADLRPALRGARSGDLRLLLVHEPDYAANETVRPLLDSVALQLSGHSHGGQVRLPGIGALLYPDMGRLYPEGLQRVEGSPLQVYTSRGIGVTGPPVRLLCPPEISLLRLVAS